MYYQIYTEMKKNPYNLSHSNLEVYAALYSLTRRGPYEKTIAGLADMLVMPEQTCRDALKYLVKRNLLQMDIIVKTKRHKNDCYQFDALLLPDAPFPTRFYKEEIKKYDKENKDLERRIENYRREKYVEGLRENTQIEHENRANEHEICAEEYENGAISKEKNQKKTIINNIKKEEVVVGDKPTAAAPQKLKEEDILPPPTSLQEVIDYAQEKQPGISMEVARDFFVYYSAKGWRYKNNGRVRNWKAELFLFDQRGKRWEKERAGRVVPTDHNAQYMLRRHAAQMGVPQEVLDMEERMRENRRREREQSEIEANTPEAKAAAERVLSKFCRNK